MSYRSAIPMARSVGRVQELQALALALEDACRGVGGVALVAGEAGIGKTHMMEHLAARAVARGARVLWGRCMEAEAAASSGAPALWPWIQVLRAGVRLHSVDDLRASLGSVAAVLSGLVPGLSAEGARAQPRVGEIGTANDRFLLFDGIVAWLGVLAATAPLLIVLEDLHWADAASLLLLRFVAAQVGEQRILVAGTYRDDELSPALSGACAELRRERGHLDLTLHGLSEPEVAELVAALAGRSLDDGGRAFAGAVHRDTLGNPLFVQEMLRLLSETSDMVGADGRWPLAEQVATTGALPRGIRDVLVRRIERLSSGCRAVLEAAAVLGREVHVVLLHRVAESGGSGGIESPSLLDAIDEAMRARLLAAVAGAMGRYSFVHGLMHEVLYAEIPSTRRAALHLRAGQTIETLYADDLRPHLAELANHFGQALVLGDAAPALRFARLASEQARLQFAYDEAARWSRAALTALDALGGSDRGRRCELLLELFDALDLAGERVAASAALAQAVETARALGDAELLARCALALAAMQDESGKVDVRRVTLLREALLAIGDGESPLRAKLLGRLAEALLYDPDAAARFALAGDAIQTARRLGDAAALFEVLITTRFALQRASNLDERLELGRELVALSDRVDQPSARLIGPSFLVHDRLEHGDREGAEEMRARMAALAPRRPSAHAAWYGHVVQTMWLLLDGRLEEAEEEMQRALAAGQRSRIPDAQQSFGVQFGYVRREQGRAAEIVPLLQALTQSQAALPSWRVALAGELAEIGELSAARAQLDAVDLDALPDDSNRLMGLSQAAEAAVALCDPAYARLLYGMLLPFAAQCFMVSLATLWYGSVSHHLGLLAGTIAMSEPVDAGWWDCADRHLADAAAVHERMRAPLFLAHTHVEQAAQIVTKHDACHGRGVADVCSGKATAVLAAVRQTAALPGRVRLARRLAAVDGLLDRLQAIRHHADSGPLARLTARENEVLRLLAAGKTNRQIAEELVITTRTVETHLFNLYGKLDVDGRAAAIALAVRLDLN